MRLQQQKNVDMLCECYLHIYKQKNFQEIKEKIENKRNKGK